MKKSCFVFLVLCFFVGCNDTDTQSLYSQTPTNEASPNSNDENHPVCSKQNLDICVTKSACQSAGGYWYGSSGSSTDSNASCNSKAYVSDDPDDLTCSKEDLDLCTTKNTCQSVGGYWYGSNGSSTDSDASCNSKTFVTTADDSNDDSDDNICSDENLDPCVTESLCQSAGGYWYGSNGSSLDSDAFCNLEAYIADDYIIIFYYLPGMWAVSDEHDPIALGCWNDSNYSGDCYWEDSIHNASSLYGNSTSSVSIRNHLSNYGNSYSSYSACNAYAWSSPVLIDAFGYYYGRLTINSYDPDSVCNPWSFFYHDDSCELLWYYCTE